MPSIMASEVLEYLGRYVDENGPTITPAPKGSLCPFSGNKCSKVNRKNPQHPVCTIKSNGKAWIVCKDRLCATSGAVINSYQKIILLQIGRVAAQSQISSDDIIFSRERQIKVPNAAAYRADYVMVIKPNTPRALKLVIEMQGGGETSNTGDITKIVTDWAERGSRRRNSDLIRASNKASPIPANAWRRQQEQFMVKGRVAVRSGGRLVFCIGELLFDYLQSKISNTPPIDLSRGNWTLCLISIKTNPSEAGLPLSISIDSSRTLFTDYDAFVRTITSVGGVDEDLFKPPFETLDGEHWVKEV